VLRVLWSLDGNLGQGEFGQLAGLLCLNYGLGNYISDYVFKHQLFLFLSQKPNLRPNYSILQA